MALPREPRRANDRKAVLIIQRFPHYWSSVFALWDSEAVRVLLCGLWTLDQKLLPSGSVRETIVTIAGKRTALRPHPWLCRVSSHGVTMTVLNNRTRGHAYPMPMRQLTGESFCPALLRCCTSCTHAEWYSQDALIGQWLARSQGRHSD
jgi:hypothetical protein